MRADRRPQPGSLLPHLAHLLALGLTGVFLAPALCGAVTLPTLQIGVAEAQTPQQVSVLIEILLLFTVLSMAPASRPSC